MSVLIKNHRFQDLNARDVDRAFAVDDGFHSSSTPTVFFYDIGMLFSLPYDEICRHTEEVVPKCEIEGNHLRNHEDRCLYLLSRYCLRKLASQLIRIAPAAIPIRAGEFGKPFVDLAHSGLSFNISHSGSIIAIALHRATVGIDVEKHRTVRDAHAIISDFFSRSERNWYARQSDGPDIAFLILWTRKEAHYKALGSGLSIPLETISLCPGIDQLDKWQIQSLPAPPGYIAALSFERP